MTPLITQSVQSPLFWADGFKWICSPLASRRRWSCTEQTAMGIADFKAARHVHRSQAGARGSGAAAGPSQSPAARGDAAAALLSFSGALSGRINLLPSPFCSYRFSWCWRRLWHPQCRLLRCLPRHGCLWLWQREMPKTWQMKTSQHTGFWIRAQIPPTSSPWDHTLN